MLAARNWRRQQKASATPGTLTTPGRATP
jgi:hypothetical protein